jgi:phospholipase/carboxylesterase
MTQYIHADLPGAAPDAPLLFLFHGTGGDETQFLELGARLLPAARRIAPRGDVSEAGANRYFRRLAEGRYDMADLGRATARMAGFVQAKRAEVPGVPAFGLGYSNGANILLSTLFARPDLFDRVVAMHPLIPFTPPDQPALAGKRVLLTAGRRDPMAHPGATEALALWLDAQGARPTLIWHEGGHEVRAGEIEAAASFLGR